METDVLIIGCGPAGLQAAIHSSRKKASTLVVGKVINSSVHGTEIENYLGASSDGDTILSEGVGQARSFGAEFLDQNIVTSGKDGDSFVFTTDDGTEIGLRRSSSPQASPGRSWAYLERRSFSARALATVPSATAISTKAAGSSW